MYSPVYDDEKEKLAEKTGQHDDLGVHPERREAEAADLDKQFKAPSAKKASSPKELAGAEKQAGKDGAAADKRIGSGYRADDSDGLGGRLRSKFNKVRGRVTKKRAAIGIGITGIFVGGAFSAFSILHGPLQLVHFAQLLQKFHFSNNEDFLDGRAGRYLRHVFSGDAERARLGFVRDRIATRVEARLNNQSGVRSIYSDPPARRLIGYEVIDAAKASGFINEMESNGINTEATPRGSRTNVGGKRVPPNPNNRFIDIEGDGGREDVRERRKATRAVVNGSGYNKVSGRLASRLLIQRGGVDFHPLKNKKRQAGEKLVDYYKKHKEERSERRKQGVTAPNKRLAGQQQLDDDGNVISDTEGEAQKGNEFADEAADAVTPDGRNDLVKKLLTGGGAAGGVAAALCIVNDIGNGIEDYKYANIILVMIRIGTEMITTGNQAQSNIDTNFDEMGAASDDLYDEEAKSSWAGGASIQAELGQEVTGPDLPEDSKPGAVGEKPALFEAVGSIPGITGACGAVDSVLSKIPVVNKVVDFFGNLATSGIDLILSPFGFSVEEFFNGVVKFFAGEVVNTYAKGAELGNIANYGSRLAANDVAIGTGGSELTPEETTELDALALANDRLDQAQKPFFARVFDTGDVDSLVVRTSMSLPRSPQATIAAIFNAPARLFSSLASTLGGGLVFAQAGSDYDYGFPEFGFAASEQNDDRFENPFENAAEVEPKLEALNEKYGKCFAMTIDSTTNRLKSGPAKRYDEIEKEPACNEQSEDLLRYRFYIADTVTAHTLACYEGVEDSCQQLFAAQNSEEQAAGETAPITDGEPPTGDVQSLAQQILAEPNITYPLDAVSPNGSTKEVLEALARGEPAPVYCTGARPGNRTTTAVNPNVLKFVLEYGQGQRVGVNALTDKCHSAGSNHYRGMSVDFECNAVPFNLVRGDAIAGKYGGKRNSETCAGQRHWHYDF